MTEAVSGMPRVLQLRGCWSQEGLESVLSLLPTLSLFSHPAPPASQVKRKNSGLLAVLSLGWAGGSWERGAQIFRKG